MRMKSRASFIIEPMPLVAFTCSAATRMSQEIPSE
jgi:hypothetical protein